MEEASTSSIGWENWGEKSRLLVYGQMRNAVAFGIARNRVIERRILIIIVDVGYLRLTAAATSCYDGEPT
jgi:hypothetical protein